MVRYKHTSNESDCVERWNDGCSDDGDNDDDWINDVIVWVSKTFYADKLNLIIERLLQSIESRDVSEFNVMLGFEFYSFPIDEVWWEKNGFPNGEFFSSSNIQK